MANKMLKKSVYTENLAAFVSYRSPNSRRMLKKTVQQGRSE
jgi:hypothetical protein